MRGRKLSSKQLADLLMTLIGEIEPVGETNTDDKRWDNLLVLVDVLDMLLDEVCWLLPYAKNYEYSMQRTGNEASRWLKEKHQWIEDILNTDTDVVHRSTILRALNILRNKMNDDGKAVMDQAIAAVESVEVE